MKRKMKCPPFNGSREIDPRPTENAEEIKDNEEDEEE